MNKMKLWKTKCRIGLCKITDMCQKIMEWKCLHTMASLIQKPILIWKHFFGLLPRQKIQLIWTVNPQNDLIYFWNAYFLHFCLNYLLISCPFSLVYCSKSTRMTNYERYTNENGQDINRLRSNLVCIDWLKAAISSKR